MEPIAIGVMALLGGGAYLLGRFTNRERSRLWGIAAEACALKDIEETRTLGIVTALAGWSGELRVRLTTYRHGKHDHGTVVVIESRHLSWLRLRRETLGTAVEKRLLGAREIQLGDEAFDNDFFVAGTSALVRAVFDAETRRVLRWLLTDVRLDVADGALRAELSEGGFSRRGFDRLPQVMTRLIEAAKRLMRPDDITGRLADNARADPLPGVRLEALMTLSREYPHDVTTAEALRVACGDPDAEIRLRAAVARGADGHPTLVELANQAPDVLAARAVTALGEHLSGDEARSMLARALRTRQTRTASACLAVLGRIGGADGVDSLAKVLRLEEGELAVAAARALGATGLPAAEAPLVKALGRSSVEVRVAAAEALGRFASIDAVLPLKEVETKPPRHDAVRRAARQAIAQIQSRASGAAPGQLSLAAGESGQLSLAVEDQAGRLSLPPKAADGPER